MSWGQFLWGKSVLRQETIWYIYRPTLVKSLAVSFSQKCANHFRHIFPPDKGEKIFGQERVTGKSPLKAAEVLYVRVHRSKISFSISIPISLFARWRLGTEDMVRVFSESENRASMAKGHEPCKQYKFGASCFMSVTYSHHDRARRPQVQPGWTTEFFPRQKSLFLMYLL